MFVCVCMCVCRCVCWGGINRDLRMFVCVCGCAPKVIYVCACAYAPNCVCIYVCEGVCGILNKQLSISVNRARGMPEAQVAQLQADTLDVRAEARAYLLLFKQGCGRGDAKCDVGRCVKGERCWEPQLRQRQNLVYVLAARGLIHRVD